MDNIVRPEIVAKAGAAAAGAEGPQERLIKYIPLDIAGAYPLLQNGVADYVKNPLPKLPAQWIIWAVFGLLLLYYVVKLHFQFTKSGIKGRARLILESQQQLVSIVAFVIWTYSLKSAIWTDVYSAGLALILVVAFLLVASNYKPTISLQTAQEGGVV